MRAGLIMIFALILMVVTVDVLLFLFIRKYFRHGKLPLLLNVVYWLIPIAFIGSFIAFFIENNQTISADGYYFFTMVNGWFLLFYLPKMVLLVYSILYQLVIKVVSWVSWKKDGRSLTEDAKGRKITRAAFLGKAGAIVAAAPFMTLLYGMAKGRFNFYTKRVELRFKNLPAAFDGLKIVQISDIHLGNFNKEYHRLHEVTSLVNAENADLLLMTGDMVNNFASETEGWEAVFSKMRARLGKYSILGNHDYGDYSRWTSQHAKRRNFDGVLSAHKRFGFQLLRNESVEIEEAGERFSLLGVENWGHPPFPQYGDLNKTMLNVPEDSFKLLMSHDPDHWEAEVWDKNIDLTLAGHTHGMQFGVKWKNAVWSPAKFKYKYWDGHYQQNNMHLYVNRGLGFIGIPMRVGMPPEITTIILRKA